VLYDAEAIDPVEYAGLEGQIVDRCLYTRDMITMITKRFGGRVDGIANVAGNDGRAGQGGDIGEPAGAAAGIQYQFSGQPFRSDRS
jgi:hypothetical protein